MATQVIPQATYQIGQRQFDAAVPVGSKVVEAKFSHVGWPTDRDCVSLSLQVSYDNKATWQELGGFTLDARNDGVVDPYVGLIDSSSLLSTLPQPAGAQTFLRVKANVLVSVTTAITINVT